MPSNLLSTFMMEEAILNGFGFKRLRTSKACKKEMGQLKFFGVVSA
jgi:hypothetical protein